MQPLDLIASARQEMLHNGFSPDFAPGTAGQLASIATQHPDANGVRDLRDLLWSSIDNDTSKDLDQVEFAERVPNGIRVLVGIADVDWAVHCGTPIDQHAAQETVTVYTPVRNFSMLPEELSTDLTSLSENADRLAIVIEFVVDANGSIASPDIYPALVRNKSQLTYNAVGLWLESRATLAASPAMQAQLKLQDEGATLLRGQRHRLGALNFDRVEAVITSADVHAARKTRANDLIEDFMIAANEVMATTLKQKGASSIRRIVKSPERWPRIVELAAKNGTTLPSTPDAAALNRFLESRKQADPVHYADLSLAVVKLMGPGEYVMTKAGETGEGHFGLAAHDYTHSTAPNRRFADLVTQRLIKAVRDAKPAPYSDTELDAIARNCTLKEDAARKVERVMAKRVAAVAMRNRIGQHFDAVVTGVTPKGTFVRLIDPPVEGILWRGQEGVDVGDKFQVTLTSTDPQKGYLDFSR
jgi:VacB/RNase II family 3'-5' exoribonuclease